eukprot:42892-Eustigmatos_ZCMA.PRE.1
MKTHKWSKVSMDDLNAAVSLAYEHQHGGNYFMFTNSWDVLHRTKGKNLFIYEVEKVQTKYNLDS